MQSMPRSMVQIRVEAAIFCPLFTFAVPCFSRLTCYLVAFNAYPFFDLSLHFCSTMVGSLVGAPVSWGIGPEGVASTCVYRSKRCSRSRYRKVSTFPGRDHHHTTYNFPCPKPHPIYNLQWPDRHQPYHNPFFPRTAFSFQGDHNLSSQEWRLPFPVTASPAAKQWLYWGWRLSVAALWRAVPAELLEFLVLR